MAANTRTQGEVRTMERSDQISCAKRLLDHVENRGTDTVKEIRRQPLSAYVSSERLAAEKAAILKQFPILVGFSNDLKNVGDFITENYVDTPVLIVRAKDGSLNAYLNMCSHRGACVASGKGEGARGFVCPYHGWVYNTEGDLVTLPHAEDFTPLDKKSLSLQRLPVEEKYGLVWLGLTPGDDFDIDTHLDDFSRDFKAFNYAGYHHYRTLELTRSMNWKMIIDTFLENYHLRILHRDTIGDSILSYTQLSDPAGDNLRLIQARKNFAELRDEPEENWDFFKRTAIAYLLFPNTLFIHQSDHVEIWRSFPDGDDPNASKIYFDFYVPEPAESEKARRYWDKNLEYGVSIVLDEDFVLGEKNQANYATSQRDFLLFGKNESGLIHYHSAIDAALNKNGAGNKIQRLKSA